MDVALQARIDRKQRHALWATGFFRVVKLALLVWAAWHYQQSGPLLQFAGKQYWPVVVGMSASVLYGIFSYWRSLHHWLEYFNTPETFRQKLGKITLHGVGTLLPAAVFLLSDHVLHIHELGAAAHHVLYGTSAVGLLVWQCFRWERYVKRQVASLQAA